MFPTAMLAGFLLGIWVRWWAALLVGLGWSVIMLFNDPDAALFGGFLAAVNGLVGVVPALVLRRLGPPRPDPRRSS